MKKLSVFNFITLNGYYKSLQGDIGWHQHGEEENAFSEENMKRENILVFGRLTYEMMAGFWPTPFAMERDPLTAAGMNNAEKIVFSKTMKKPEWNNTRLINEHAVEEMAKLKLSSSKDLTILGSGSLWPEFAKAGLIDEFSFMIDPVAISHGVPIFNGIDTMMKLKLTGTRTFKSGTVLMTYSRE